MVDPQYVDEELTKAHQAFGDAKRLLDSGGSDEGVVNRLYYAAFHGAQAFLYERDVEPTSHGAVRNLFGTEGVLEGEVAREHGRLLTTLADLRQQADYGYDAIDEDVSDLVTRTERFLDAVEAAMAGTGSG